MGKFARFHTTNRRENFFFCTDRNSWFFPFSFFPCQFHCEVITSGEGNGTKARRKLGEFSHIFLANPCKCCCGEVNLRRTNLLQRDWTVFYFKSLFNFTRLVLVSERKKKWFMTLSWSSLKQQIYIPCLEAIKLNFDWALRVFSRLMQIEKNYTVLGVKHQMELSALGKFVTVRRKNARENLFTTLSGFVSHCMLPNETR